MILSQWRMSADQLIEAYRTSMHIPSYWSRDQSSALASLNYHTDRLARQTHGLFTIRYNMIYIMVDNDLCRIILTSRGIHNESGTKKKEKTKIRDSKRERKWSLRCPGLRSPWISKEVITLEAAENRQTFCINMTYR